MFSVMHLYSTHKRNIFEFAKTLYYRVLANSTMNIKVH
jgi:hypothetical protein